MKNIIKGITAVTLLFTSISVSAQSNVAKISGMLKNDEKMAVLSYDGAESMLGGSRNIEIKADSNGYFSVDVPLEKPSYFRFERNTLYLTPGDKLEMVIFENSDEALFKGKGAEANQFLRKRTFPKGGSYIESGRAAVNNTDSMLQYIDDRSKERLEELKALKNVSSDFKEMEEARIYADVINSLLMYPLYRKDLMNLNNHELFKSKSDSILNSYTPKIKSLIPRINNDKFLNVEVVRYVLSSLMRSENLSKDIVYNDRINELYGTLKKIGILSIDPTIDNIKEIKEYLKTMKYDDLRNELSKKLNSVGELVKGAPAFDFEMQDVNGKSTRLSNFKGKYIYIDFWATWCGPCKAEAPHFERLRKEVPDEDIVFLAVSTDSSKDAWLKYLAKEEKMIPQFHSTDKVLRQNWLIAAIPRFILIDKDFNIVNAYSIRPSNEKAKAYFDDLLKQ